MLKARNYLLSNKIAHYLKQAEMNQNELAELSGYDRYYISRLINGKIKCPSLATGIIIAEVLGQNVEDVFNYKPE